MEQSLMEKFADPALFDSLNMGEKLAGALMTMVMGMGITFIVLIMLWGIIALTTKILNRSSNKPTAAVADTNAAGSGAATSGSGATATGDAGGSAVTVKDASGAEVTDGELIAVITAAIEAYESESAVQSNLVIRKIDRSVGRSTAWSRAGAQATIDSRMI